MLGAEYTNVEGETRSLREDDFMVVAPYNAQVRCLREAAPAGVRTSSGRGRLGRRAASTD